MLTDEQVISVRRNRDCYLKLIDLVRLTCDEKETCVIFRNTYKITSMEEKILYLLFVYINNSDEDIIDILRDTEIVPNNIVNSFLDDGININEINSDIVKSYLATYGGVESSLIIDELDSIEKEYKQEIKNNSCIDYNLNRLKKEDIKKVEARNRSLKRKIRRKILYDEYQGRY